MSVENTQLATISEIQSSYIFEIPGYQRGYAWGLAQWEDLWQDLENLIERTEGDHYTGSLMLRYSKVEEGTKKTVEVVDGQQRLTTISLVLRALNSPPIEIKFQENDFLQTYFDFFALGKKELACRIGHEKSFYGQNMHDAAKYFEDKVGKLSQLEKQKISNAIQQRLKLFLLKIPTAFDINIAFETINNRGKSLTSLEKLKNRLIYLAGTAADVHAGQTTTNEIHECWKNIYHWLGRGDALLSDEDFLKAHSAGMFQYQPVADWLETQLFETEFSSKPNSIPPSSISAYVRSLENSAAWWYHLNQPKEMPKKTQQLLQLFNRTSFDGARPVLLWALVQLGNTSNEIISNPSINQTWSNPFESLLIALERFAVLIFMANDRKSNYAQSHLYKITHQLAHPQLADIEDDEGISNDQSPEAFIYAISDHINTMATQALDHEDEKAITAAGKWREKFSPDVMKAVIADRLVSRTGFYKWDFGKLVVYEWEMSLRGTKGRMERNKPWEKFHWDQSIEHIYPQTPNDYEWPSFPFDGRTSSAIKNSVTNSIGNLLLFSKSRNSSARNASYKIKRTNYYSKEGSYSESQISELCSDWSPLTIAARGIAMMRLAENRWGFNLVRRDSLKDILDWLPIVFGPSTAKHLEKTEAWTGNTALKLSNLVSKFEADLKL